MKRTHLFLAAILVVGVAAAPSATHFAIVKSTPSSNQTVAESPKRIQIWFSQVPVEAVSQMTLAGADKAEVPLGKVVADKASKSIYADVTAALKPGAYVASWRSAGDDGHVQTGEIKFTFTPRAGA
jgi:methionine-rich copper-binding protein CopC